MPREPASVDTDLLHLETQMKGASCVLKTLSGLHVSWIIGQTQKFDLKISLWVPDPTRLVPCVAFL